MKTGNRKVRSHFPGLSLALVSALVGIFERVILGKRGSGVPLMRCSGHHEGQPGGN